MNIAELRSAVAENMDKIVSVSDGKEIVIADKGLIELHKEIIPKIAEAFIATFPESEFDFDYHGYDAEFYIDNSLLTITADEVNVAAGNREKAKYLYEALEQYAESFSISPGFDGKIVIGIGFPDVTVNTVSLGIVLGDHEKFAKGRKNMVDAFRKLLDNDFENE